ncbi:UPF0280 family protein [Candidatus Bathyarchaeota archaeon]|nr:UPF0280 family protein [Candidatus Bathyarchaeota archaeon]
MRKEAISKLHYVCGESRGVILSNEDRFLKIGYNSIQENREKLERFARQRRDFLLSFEPVKIREGPRVALLMADSAEAANVGPMAAVAGVLADLAVEDMVNEGASLAVVENGGEASVHTQDYVDVALRTGATALSNRICFRIEEPSSGLATSSGLHSHAFSLGEADAVTVFAENSGVADAAATSVGNQIVGEDAPSIIKQGITRALSIKGVHGVIVLYNEHYGVGGRVPKMIGVKSMNEVYIH